MRAPAESRDPWAKLRAATTARIDLARAGSSIATRNHLAFQLDHARARDAVHEPLDAAALAKGLAQRHLPFVHLRSAATDRRAYLMRPDLGRRLDERSRKELDVHSGSYDLAFVLADGLSARAVTIHALPLLDLALPALLRGQWKIGPIVIAEQARVAVGDEIGQMLGATLVAVLIGERPGLSSPDGLGIYITWQPAIGRLDADRNCLSNIRPQGMPYAEAARRLLYLCTQAKRIGRTGIALKDLSAEALQLPPSDSQ